MTEIQAKLMISVLFILCLHCTNGQLGNYFSQPSVLERNDIQDARNLVSGASFYIYINGSVGAFGINNFGQLGLGDKQRRQKPGILLSLGQNIIDIAGCVYATYALTKDGLVYAFGDNTQGYLGQGDTIARLTPILIPSLTNVSVISAGVVSGHFLTSDGRMWSVGTCSYGDFGIGIDFADYYVPVMAIFPPNVFLTQISSGGRHIIALTNESLVYSFGYNIGGQLGLGILNVSCSTPQSVPIANVASVGTGDLTSYFFKKNGEVWSVGSNPLGELGLGDYISRSTPQKVLIPTPMNFIAPGSACVAWNLKGEAWYWGSNQQGQLGLTDVNGRSTPFLHPLLSIYKIEKAKNGYINTILFTKDKIILIGNIGSDNSVPSIASGLFGSTIKVGAAFQHSVSLQGDSSLLASGLNTNGQVIGTDRLNRIIPIRIRLDVAPNIQDICTSMRNNLILTKNGQVFAYGSNDKGQSGMGDVVNGQFNPLNVLTPNLLSVPFVQKIVCGLSNSNAVISNSSQIYIFGDNAWGQLGLGLPILRGYSNISLISAFSNVSDAALGEKHSVFLLSNGTVFVAGDNVNGRLGLGTLNQATVALTRNPFLPKINKIRAGLSDTMAYSASNSMYAWGLNDFGQLCLGNTLEQGTPLTIDLSFLTTGESISDFRLGERFSMLLTTSKRVYVCGSNQQGQLGLGDFGNRLVPTLNPFLRNVESIATGWSHAFALIASCPNSSYAGYDCNIPICNLIPSTDIHVCSGSGTCLAPETCQCSFPSTGKYCESKEYRWRGSVSALWADLDNWFFLKDGVESTSLSYPSLREDRVIFDVVGDFDVKMNGINVEIASISISPTARIALDIQNTNLSIWSSNNLSTLSKLNIKSSNVTVISTLTVGASTWADSSLNGNLVIQGATNLVGQMTLVSTSINIQSSGVLKISSQISTQSTIFTNYGKMDVMEGGFISNDSFSLLQNFGTITIRSTSPSWMLIPVQNGNIIDFGNSTVVMDTYFANSTGQLTSIGSLNVTTLTLNDGDFNLGGILNGNIDFNSTSGTLRFISAVIIRGNLTIQSTVFFSLISSRITNFITVMGHTRLTGLFLLLLDNYNPYVGDFIDFMSVKSTEGTPIIYLLGAPFKNAELISSPNGDLSFKITTSFVQKC